MVPASDTDWRVDGARCRWCLQALGVCVGCGEKDLPYTDGLDDARCGVCDEPYVRMAPSLEALVFDKLRRG